MRRLVLSFLLAYILLPGLDQLVGASPQAIMGVRCKCPLEREYFLFAPARVAPKRTYWLVVQVHGFGGAGNAQDPVGQWVTRGDCIAVSPSFPNPGYTLLESKADEQLVGIFKQLREKYDLHPKLFVMGHSGGAQFAHRFTLRHPELVAGCAATSAGSWATGRHWGDLNPKAVGVPIAMSCGLKDTGKMHPDAPMGRLDWARKFEQLLAKDEYCYKAAYWPGAGHGGNPQGNELLAAECFSLATSGMLGRDRQEVDAAIARIAISARSRNPAQARRMAGDLSKRVEARDEKRTAAMFKAAGWKAGPEGLAAANATAAAYVRNQVEAVLGAGP